MSKYTLEYGKQFAIEFDQYPEDQQDAILNFVTTYQQFGLSDFSKFEGKITPSWRGVSSESETYLYAKTNNLWHYHVGLPEYVKSKYNDYYTSDWLLHFIWETKGTHIVLVDILPHYKHNREFHLPNQKYLDY